MKIHLGIPLTEPEPVPGCKECQQWAREREAAKAEGDESLVSDCNVHIRRHPHKPPETATTTPS